MQPSWLPGAFPVKHIMNFLNIPHFKLSQSNGYLLNVSLDKLDIVNVLWVKHSNGDSGLARLQLHQLHPSSGLLSDPKVKAQLVSHQLGLRNLFKITVQPLFSSNITQKNNLLCQEFTQYVEGGWISQGDFLLPTVKLGPQCLVLISTVPSLH